MKLIDKDALVAEIKTRIETYNKGYANGDDCRADALETFLHDIDFLEVKEVKEEPESKDLEDEIDRYTEYLDPKDIKNAPFTHIEECARHFAKWQKQELIDKACEWLRQHMKTLPELSNKDLTKHTLWKRDEIIDKFRQAMEERL